MARIARVVVPGTPHHVTQRGNRRQDTFFRDEDYEAYIDLMSREKYRDINPISWHSEGGEFTFQQFDTA